eukprot:jgi/Bigna1/68220/fgenesh1_pg.5_\
MGGREGRRRNRKRSYGRNCGGSWAQGIAQNAHPRYRDELAVLVLGMVVDGSGQFTPKNKKTNRVRGLLTTGHVGAPAGPQQERQWLTSSEVDKKTRELVLSTLNDPGALETATSSGFDLFHHAALILGTLASQAGRTESFLAYFSLLPATIEQKLSKFWLVTGIDVLISAVHHADTATLAALMKMTTREDPPKPLFGSVLDRLAELLNHSLGMIVVIKLARVLMVLQKKAPRGAFPPHHLKNTLDILMGWSLDPETYDDSRDQLLTAVSGLIRRGREPGFSVLLLEKLAARMTATTTTTATTTPSKAANGDSNDESELHEEGQENVSRASAVKNASDDTLFHDFPFGVTFSLTLVAAAVARGLLGSIEDSLKEDDEECITGGASSHLPTAASIDETMGSLIGAYLATVNAGMKRRSQAERSGMIAWFDAATATIERLIKQIRYLAPSPPSSTSSMGVLKFLRRSMEYLQPSFAFSATLSCLRCLENHLTALDEFYQRRCEGGSSDRKMRGTEGGGTGYALAGSSSFPSSIHEWPSLRLLCRNSHKFPAPIRGCLLRIHRVLLLRRFPFIMAPDLGDACFDSLLALLADSNTTTSSSSHEIIRFVLDVFLEDHADKNKEEKKNKGDGRRLGGSRTTAKGERPLSTLIHSDERVQKCVATLLSEIIIPRLLTPTTPHKQKSTRERGVGEGTGKRHAEEQDDEEKGCDDANIPSLITENTRARRQQGAGAGAPCIPYATWLKALRLPSHRRRRRCHHPAFVERTQGLVLAMDWARECLSRRLPLSFSENVTGKRERGEGAMLLFGCYYMIIADLSSSSSPSSSPSPHSSPSICHHPSAEVRRGAAALLHALALRLDYGDVGDDDNEDDNSLGVWDKDDERQQQKQLLTWARLLVSHAALSRSHDTAGGGMQLNRTWQLFSHLLPSEPLHVASAWQKGLEVVREAFRQTAAKSRLSASSTTIGVDGVYTPSSTAAAAAALRGLGGEWWIFWLLQATGAEVQLCGKMARCLKEARGERSIVSEVLARPLALTFKDDQFRKLLSTVAPVVTASVARDRKEAEKMKGNATQKNRNLFGFIFEVIHNGGGGLRPLQQHQRQKRRLIVNDAVAPPALLPLAQTDPEVMNMWLGISLGKYLVRTRLKTPIGGPLPSLSIFETILTSTATGGAAGGESGAQGAREAAVPGEKPPTPPPPPEKRESRSWFGGESGGLLHISSSETVRRGRTLLQMLEVVEKLMGIADDGSFGTPSPYLRGRGEEEEEESRTTVAFFRANARVVKSVLARAHVKAVGFSYLLGCPHALAIYGPKLLHYLTGKLRELQPHIAARKCCG